MKEKIAAFMHGVWVEWMEYLLSFSEDTEHVSILNEKEISHTIINKFVIDSLKKIMETNYNDLDEDQKEYYRNQTDKLFKYIIEIEKNKEKSNYNIEVENLNQEKNQLLEKITFGEKIKSLRIKNNIDQSSLAEIIGVTQSAISQFENNIRIPSEENIIKLSEIFNNELELDDIPESNFIKCMRIFKTLNQKQISLLYDVACQFKISNGN
jgi:transcriptional regulator with XRE-family HTH domain